MSMLVEVACSCWFDEQVVTRQADTVWHGAGDECSWCGFAVCLHGE